MASNSQAIDEVDNLPSQLEGLNTLDEPAQTVTINYDDGKYACLPLVESGLLQDLLIGKEKRAIVLVGEKNFTFTVAIATLRKSWEGIISTRYEDLSDDFPEPQFDDVKLQCISSCISNSKALSGTDEVTAKTTLKNIQEILNLQSPTAQVWRYGIDATRIHSSITVKGKVVWFQCPWVLNAHQNNELLDLIRDFLQHVSSKQSQDDYVLIGITKFYPYLKNYRLQDLLGVHEDKGHFRRQCGNYKLLGVDNTLIKKILLFGYKHKTVQDNCDIHTEIIEDHITLVFKKKLTAQ